MMNKTVILSPDGSAEIKAWTEGRPDLEFMQKAVGGYVQLIPHLNIYSGENCDAYCNEEGLLQNLETNAHANQVWHDNLKGQLYDASMVNLFGNVLFIIGDAKFRGEDDEDEDEAA